MKQNRVGRCSCPSSAPKIENYPQGGSEAKGADASVGGGGIRMGRLRGPRSSFSSSSTKDAAGAKGVTSGARGGGSRGYGDADVAKLKEAIQTLCQSTNPLGEINAPL